MLDEKMTDAVENLAEAVHDHWGPGNFTLSITVAGGLYRLELRQATRCLDRLVDRERRAASLLDPLAVALDTLGMIVAKGGRP